MDNLIEKYLGEEYKVAKNPSDKLWYAWVPISSGYKSKKEAEAFAKKQPNLGYDIKFGSR